MNKVQTILKEFGWNKSRTLEFKDYALKGYIPGRIVCEENRIYKVVSEFGELTATVSGRMWYHTDSRSNFPSIGDWVAIKAIPEEGKAQIHSLLSRTSFFSRKAAGEATREQIVAANIDRAFIVTDMDRDFNPRRLERYILLAKRSGTDPVIVLNKMDLCSNIEEAIGLAREVAGDIPILPVSALEHEGIESIALYIQKGETGVFIGSSGVGKSALVNALTGGNEHRVGPIREADGRGRHTTSHKELILLPDGGAIIDSPGMRELHLWADPEEVNDAFPEIEELSLNCRFKDCNHLHEPDCAVREALEKGQISIGRLNSYHKLQNECLALSKKQFESTRKQESAQRIQIAKLRRKIKIKD
jgi:ribosome biogenesis GTPase